MLNRLLLIGCIAFALSSCGEASLADRVDMAVCELGAGKVDNCRALCDSILADSADFNALTSKQLCILSELYLRLPDDLESNDGNAARCISRARALDVDTLNEYIRQAPSDLGVRMQILDRVGAYLEIPRDSLVSIEDIHPEDEPEESTED